VNARRLPPNCRRACQRRATTEFQSLDVPYGFTRCEVRSSADEFPADDASSSPSNVPIPGAHYSCMKPATRGLPFISERPGIARKRRHRRYASSPGCRPSSLEYALFVLPTDFGARRFQRHLLNMCRPRQCLGCRRHFSSHSTRIPVFCGNILESRNYSRTGDRFLSVGDADPSYPL